MTALELDPIGDRPEARREANVVVDGGELVIRLNMEANTRGWR
jgi:hypothetical protein